MTANQIASLYPHASKAFIKANLTETVSEVGLHAKRPVKGNCEPLDGYPKGIQFTIPGQPVGSPRMTQSDRWNKRPRVIRYREWCNKALECIPQGSDLSEIRYVKYIAYMTFPKTYSGKKRLRLSGQGHLQKPDIDNLAKSLLDAVFLQDRVIWKLEAEKRWDDGKGPRMEVVLK